MSQFSPERHRWLDPWRGARGPSLHRLVATIAAAIEDHETGNGLRTRRRKPSDQVNHLLAIDAVVSNLAHGVLLPPETGRLAILTGNGSGPRTRYDNAALGKPLRTLLGRLEDIGLVNWRQSHQRRVASSLAPTEAFARAVVDAGVTLADFGRIEGEEVILLARVAIEYQHARRTRHRERIDYADTAETVAMRADMHAINAFLQAADITFQDDGMGMIDPHDRRMRRHFVIADTDPLSQRFDRGGRLYGGFWQNLKRARRAGIRIGGEQVAVLDYSAMFPRLAYAATGVRPPQGDIYAVAGLEGHRPAVKRAMNTLLFDTSPHRPSWPKAEEGDAEMPPDWTVQRFRQALLARHPALKDSLGHGLGHHLMHTESKVMTGVLMALMAEGVVALPLHDGVLVPISKVREVGTMMEAVAREITSSNLPVASSGTS